MASSFVKIPPPKSKRKNWLGRPETESVWFQFIPGIVIDVATNFESAATDNKPRNLNGIIAKAHLGDNKPLAAGTANTVYYPLFRGMVDVPTKGDPVLLCQFGGVNYYMGPINTMNNPNFNPDHMNKPEPNRNPFRKKRTIAEKLGLSKGFGLLPFKRLQKPYNDKLDKNEKSFKDIPGDMVFEGRFGNSIRLGSRNINPYLMISNGRSVTNTIESTKDGAIFTMTQSGTIREHFAKEYKKEGDGDNIQIILDPFVLASDTIEDANRLIGGDKYNYDFNKPQVLLSSDRITFNSTNDSIILSSKINTILGAGNNIDIISNGSTTIETGNLFLGNQSKEKKEPFVLGTQLKLFLEELIDIISPAAGLVQGVPVALTDGGPAAGTLKVKLEGLKKKLATPAFNSEYHFIEDNGQKQ
tara:strand:+ start:1615 stop:2856 length:1242 start_codon:yes stop_codon:yes gene_type:complete